MKSELRPQEDAGELRPEHAGIAVPHERGATERRNFRGLCAYQVLLRAAWIFKTETLIIPAVLDLLSGQDWIRGCLPLLNRVGYSGAPILLHDHLKAAPLKKRWLLASCVLMAGCFLLLAGVWRLRDASWSSTVSTWAFLAAYTTFFLFAGVNQLAYDALQGKLMPAAQRGRLMSVSNAAGSVLAIGLAMWFLPAWLARADFTTIFCFSSFGFLAAAASALMLHETPDAFPPSPRTWEHWRGSMVRTLIDDSNFCRLSVVAALFGLNLTLFPHYQALGRVRLGVQLTDLLLLVVIQNVGTAGFSLWIGPLADRRGSRIALQWAMLALASVPLVALLLAWWGTTAASFAFSLVFLLVGLTPVALRSLNNYTLEIALPADQPRYLSVLNVACAAPIMFSPAVGAWIGAVGFATPFLVIAAATLLGGGLCFGLAEPVRPLVPESPGTSSPRDAK